MIENTITPTENLVQDNSKTTLWRWLEKLENTSRIQSVSDMKQIKIDVYQIWYT